MFTKKECALHQVHNNTQISEMVVSCEAGISLFFVTEHPEKSRTRYEGQCFKTACHPANLSEAGRFLFFAGGFSMFSEILSEGEQQHGTACRLLHPNMELATNFADQAAIANILPGEGLFLHLDILPAHLKDHRHDLF